MTALLLFQVTNREQGFAEIDRRLGVRQDLDVPAPVLLNDDIVSEILCSTGHIFVVAEKAGDLEFSARDHCHERLIFFLERAFGGVEAFSLVSHGILPGGLPNFSLHRPSVVRNKGVAIIEANHFVDPADVQFRHEDLVVPTEDGAKRHFICMEFADDRGNGVSVFRSGLILDQHFADDLCDGRMIAKEVEIFGDQAGAALVVPVFAVLIERAVPATQKQCFGEVEIRFAVREGAGGEELDLGSFDSGVFCFTKDAQKKNREELVDVGTSVDEDRGDHSVPFYFQGSMRAFQPAMYLGTF